MVLDQPAPPVKIGASGAKPTRACVPRTVNGTGQTLVTRGLAWHGAHRAAILTVAVQPGRGFGGTLEGVPIDGREAPRLLLYWRRGALTWPLAARRFGGQIWANMQEVLSLSK